MITLNVNKYSRWSKWWVE